MISAVRKVLADKVGLSGHDLTVVEGHVGGLALRIRQHVDFGRQKQRAFTEGVRIAFDAYMAGHNGERMEVESMVSTAMHNLRGIGKIRPEMEDALRRDLVHHITGIHGVGKRIFEQRMEEKIVGITPRREPVRKAA